MSEDQKILRVKLNFILALARRGFEVANHPEDHWDLEEGSVRTDDHQTESLHMHLDVIQDILNQENTRDIKYAWGALVCRDEMEEMLEEQAISGHPEDGKSPDYL